MRADRLQTNTYPISHRPARAALLCRTTIGESAAYLPERFREK